MLPYAARSRLAHARGRVERAVRGFLHGSTPSWRRLPNRVPWFDEPDALEQVARRATSPAEAERFTHWVRDGYFIASGLVDPVDIDEMIALLDSLWEAPGPIPGLTLLDLREHEGEPPRHLSHAEVLALPPPVRARMRAASDWRIHGLHYVNAAAARLFRHQGLRGVVTRLFGRSAQPFAAINFMSGSQQHLHQDMAVFHIYPHDFLVGAWIACEDVTAESGPLVFHPGSHRAGMFPGFRDYPQTNLRTADPDTTRAYEAWVDAIAAGHPRSEFLARKGDVLFWHGALLHGGAPVLRRGVSRKSMVIHYTVRGADRGREVHGPFNW